MKPLYPAANTHTVPRTILLMLTVCLLLGKLSAFRAKPVFVLGLSPLVITSASMQPEFPVNSLIIVSRADFDTLKVGDVIVFRSVALNGGLAFHRIIRAEEGGYYTKGDNNSLEDNQLVTRAEYVGKAVCQISFLARYVEAVSSPWGFVAFFVLPLAAVVAARYAQCSWCKCKPRRG